MEWISALLAFATTMLFFSILVSTIVEMIHRLLRMRETGLQRLLQNYYRLVIEPVGPETPPTSAAKFAMMVTGNRAISEPATELTGASKIGAALTRLTDWITNAAAVSHLPVEVFMERLASSGIFAKDKFATPEGPQILKDFGQKYVALGAEMSEHFERRARLFSILIAMVVAYVCFVHPYRIALAYLENDMVATRVSDLGKDLQAKVDAQIKASPTAAQPTSAMLNAVKRDIEKLKQEFDGFTLLGAPVGWPSETDRATLPSCEVEQENAVAPASANSESVPSRENLELFCVEADGSANTKSWSSILWLLLGGLLIGLGSPFWVKVITALTPAKDTAGKIREIFSTAGGLGLVSANIKVPEAPVAESFAAADQSRKV